jgi:hypothetical protein
VFYAEVAYSLQLVFAEDFADWVVTGVTGWFLSFFFFDFSVCVGGGNLRTVDNNHASLVRNFLLEIGEIQRPLTCRAGFGIPLFWRLKRNIDNLPHSPEPH